MKKVIISKDNRREKLYPTIIYAFFMLLSFVFFIKMRYFQYDTPDDFYFAAIVGGLFGDFCPYMLNGSSVLGFIFTVIYKVLPVCNWVTVFYVVMILLGYVLLFRCLVEKQGGINGLLLAVLLFISTVPIFYNNMNFSRIAAGTIIMGLLVIDYELCRERGSKLVLFLGIVLVLYGSMVRLNVCLMMAPFAILIYLYRLIDFENIFKGSIVNRNNLKQYYPTLCLVFGLVMLVLLADKTSYKINPEWDYYKTFDVKRTEIYDYYIADYDEFNEQYAELGIDRIDVDMFHSAHYTDTSFYTLDLLEKIKSVDYNHKGYDNFADYMAENYKKRVLLLPIGILTIFALTIILVNGGTEVYLVLSSLILGTLEVCYLYYKGRTPDRVLLLPLLAVFVICIYHIPKPKRDKDYYCVITIAIIMAALFSGLLTRTKGEEYRKGRENTISLLSQLSAQTDNLYLLDIVDSYLYEAYGPFDRFEIGLCQNCVIDGGWMIPFPMYINKAEEIAGDKNIYKDLLYSDNTYLVGDTMLKDKLAYLRLHYGDEVSASQCDVLNGYPIISINVGVNKYDNNADIDWHLLNNIIAKDGSEFIAIEVDSGVYGEEDYLSIVGEDGVQRMYDVQYVDGRLISYIYADDWKSGEEARIRYIHRDTDGKCVVARIENEVMFE